MVGFYNRKARGTYLMMIIYNQIILKVRMDKLGQNNSPRLLDILTIISRLSSQRLSKILDIHYIIKNSKNNVFSFLRLG